jgi:hypothetical protein
MAARPALRSVGRDASEISLVGGHLEKGVGTGAIANVLPVASSTTRSVGAGSPQAAQAPSEPSS